MQLLKWIFVHQNLNIFKYDTQRFALKLIYKTCFLILWSESYHFLWIWWFVVFYLFQNLHHSLDEWYILDTIIYWVVVVNCWSPIIAYLEFFLRKVIVLELAVTVGMAAHNSVWFGLTQKSDQTRNFGLEIFLTRPDQIVL